MNVYWTRLAQRHLRAIHDYIALDSIRHARQVVDRITRKSERLSMFPLSGAEVPEYGDPSIRELLYRSYRVIYRLRPDQVDVVAVLHGAKPLPDELPESV
jgi:toxin ParE1/3/4